MMSAFGGKMKYLLCSLPVIMILACSPVEFFDDNDDSSVQISQEKNTATLNWKPSPSPNVTEYLVQIKDGDTVIRTERVIHDPSTKEYALDIPLSQGDYTVSLLEKKGEQAEPEMLRELDPITVVTKAEAPKQAEITNSVVFQEGIKIGWTPPKNTGIDHEGSPATITGYTIYWSKGDSVDTATAHYYEVTSPDIQHHTITGLDKDADYSFVVVAKNSDGVSSVVSTPRTLTTPAVQSTPPQAPTDVQTTTSKQGITVSWKPPSDTGTTNDNQVAAISFYTLYWDIGSSVDTSSPFSHELPASNTEYLVTGLQGKTQYSFIILARSNARLSSSPSTIITATSDPASPSSPPRDLAAQTVTENTIDISWSAPEHTGKTEDDQDATITAYIVYWQEGDSVDTSATSYQELPPADTSYTIQNLNGKTDYTFMVIAQNSAGFSSDTSIPQTKTTQSAATAPTAPTEIQISQIDADAMRISWITPSNPGKTDLGNPASLTGYTLYWQEGDSVDVSSTLKKDLATALHHYTITGLRGKSEYAVIVVAQNNVGLSSTPSITETATTLSARQAAAPPTTPTISNQQSDRMTISWSAPDDLGKIDTGDAAELTGYIIYWQEGDSVDVSSPNSKTVTSASSQYTIGSLKGKTTYSFIVVTKNNADLTSAPSAMQTATTFTALAAADAPDELTTSNIQKDSITLSWSAPSNAGKTDTGEDATITGYTLYWNEGDALDTASAEKQTLTSRQATVDNLKGKTQYAFMVLAQNSASLSSTPSATQTATTLTARLSPTAPSGITTSNVQKDRITLSWSAPSNAGKTDTGEVATITGYTLYWNEGDTLNTASAKKKVFTSRQATIDNLKGKTQYAFRVLAQNNASLTSTPSATQTATTLTARLAATAPSGITASNVQKNSITLSWPAPSNAGKTDTGEDATITGYTLYWNEGKTLNTASAKKQTLTSRQATIDNLKGKTQYAFRVLAQNSASLTSTPSATQTATTLTARLAATAPSGLTTSNVQKDSITLSWSAPSNAGKTDTGEVATITSYTLYWNEGDTLNTASAKKQTLTSRQATIDNLKGKTQYAFWVLAQNNASLTSTPSATQTATTLTARLAATAPSGVTTSNVQKDSITLSWPAPNNAGKTDTGEVATITGYTLYWNEGDTVNTANAKKQTLTSRQATIDNLRGKTQYAFRVLAQNSASLSSTPSATQTATTLTAAIPPLEPTNFVASDIEADKITLSWAAPSNAGKTDTGDNASLARYTVYWKEGDSVDVSSPNSKDITAGTRQFIVTGLQGRTQYSFMVVAKNNAELVSNPNPTTTETTAIPIVLIDTWQKLQNMNNDLAAHYRLASDITFPDPNTGGFPAVGFTPIGSLEQPFTGVLYGNGKKISNLYIKKGNDIYIALFGVIDAPDKDIEVVTDLTFVNPNIEGRAGVASCVGYLKTGIIKNINAIGTGSIKHNYYDLSILGNFTKIGGGIAGAIGENAALYQGYNEITVTGGGLVGINAGTVTGNTTGTSDTLHYAAGLVAHNLKTGIVRGYVIGDVMGYDSIGGLVGVNAGTVRGYFDGTISGRNDVGGLVGQNKEGGSVIGYSRGSVSLRQESSQGNNMGGLVAANYGKVYGHTQATITGGNYVGGLVGFNLAGAMVIGVSYATIKAQLYVGGLVGIAAASSRVEGYATSEIKAAHYVGGLIGKVRKIDDVSSLAFYGFSLSYIATGMGSNSIHVGTVVGDWEITQTNRGYFGNTETAQNREDTTAGAGDRMFKAVASNPNSAPVIIQGEKSKNKDSFSGFTFSTNDWEWKEGYTSYWPQLNIPEKIPDTEYDFSLHQSVSITLPTWFVE